MQFFDHAEFVRQPREHFGPQRAVAFLRSGKAQLPQIRKRGLVFRHGEFRENSFVQRELEIAAIGDVERRAQQFRMIREKLLHFRRRLEPGFAGRDFRRCHRRQQPAGADGIHRAVMQMLLRPQKINIVRSNERDAEFAADVFGFAQRAAVAGREVLDFDPQSVGENIFQRCKPFRTGTACRAPTIVCVMQSRRQRTERDYAFYMFRQFLQRYWPTVAFLQIIFRQFGRSQVTQRRELAQVAVALHIRRQQHHCHALRISIFIFRVSRWGRRSAKFDIKHGSHNRLHACRFRRLVKRDRRIQPIRIRQRHGRHLLRGCRCDDLFRRRHAPQKRIVAMTMKMDKHVTGDS